MQKLGTGVLFVFLIAAAVGDYRRKKIPNRLILMGVLSATLIAALQGGHVLFSAVTGGTIALMMGYLFWKAGLFRAGDAKLLWMTMQFVGSQAMPKHLACIFLSGGVYALFLLLKQRMLVQRLKRVWSYLATIVLSGKLSKYPEAQNDPMQLPFALAVLLGEVVAHFVR